MDNENRTESSKAGVIIERIVGCGRFQLIITICLFCVNNIPVVFTMLFMAFGNYNPGWRCNDVFNLNDSFNDSDISNIDNQNIFSQVEESAITPMTFNKSEMDSMVEMKQLEYLVHDNCSLFHSCKNIEFDPTTSTIVSEWGLLCEKKWIPPIIISIQMAGVFAGALVVGHLADAYGRKPVVYGAALAMVCFNFASIFSVSWRMLAVFRFFLGICCAQILCLYSVFATEFVPQKWRSVLQGIPAWSLCCVIWALICMGLKNWRHIHIIGVILGIIGFIPVVWIPESLRWLEVKSTSKNFERAAEKIARTNGKSLPSLETLQEMTTFKAKHDDVSTESRKIYNFLHLFKKGYAKYTIMIMIPWFTIMATAYGLKFGIKALQGNFYLNLIIHPLLIVPFCILPIFLPNLVGRKLATIMFGAVVVVCLLGAAILELTVKTESVKSIGIPALIFTSFVCLDAMWCTFSVFTMELYPTVVRGIALSWANTVGRLGTIAAPFLSPDLPQGAYVSYTIMAALLFISCGILSRLPETKGKPLKNRMDIREDEDGSTDVNECVTDHNQGGLNGQHIQFDRQTQC